MGATTASNLEIAKLANTHARADFATWLMMAKLRSIEALPQEAQTFHAGYLKLLEAPGAAQEDAAEATIQLVYRSYYARMGGTGAPPRIQPAPKAGVDKPTPPSDNVTPFRRIKPSTPPPAAAKSKSNGTARPRMPVALIFLGLIGLAVAWHYVKF